MYLGEKSIPLMRRAMGFIRGGGVWRIISEGLAAGLWWVCSQSPEPGARQGPPSAGHCLLGLAPSQATWGWAGLAALCPREGSGTAVLAKQLAQILTQAEGRNLDPFSDFRPWAGSDSGPAPHTLMDRFHTSAPLFRTPVCSLGSRLVGC